MSEARKQRLEQIHRYADKLQEVAHRYDTLRYMAEQAEATGIFLEMAEAAGALTLDSLSQSGRLLEILFRAVRYNPSVDDA